MNIFLGQHLFGSTSFWVNIFLGERLLGESLLGESLLGESFLGERLLGERLLGERLLGESLLGQRYSGSTSFWSKSFWSQSFWSVSKGLFELNLVVITMPSSRRRRCRRFLSNFKWPEDPLNLSRNQKSFWILSN